MNEKCCCDIINGFFLLQAVYDHLGYISVDVPIVNIPLMVQKLLTRSRDLS